MAKTSLFSFSRTPAVPSAPLRKHFDPLSELSEIFSAARAAFSFNMHEYDALVREYTHMREMPDEAYALTTLRKIASCVKPIMRKRGWKVGTLSEFYPDQSNLLGLNVNHGQQIMVRLRYANNKRSFMPFEDVLDTMLHELCHIEIGPHNSSFHKLWDTLRDEWYALQIKGYTGEGFLGNGRMLGGRQIPNEELRRRARAAAQQRERERLTKGPRQASGRRLGGVTPKPRDPRDAVAEATIRRTKDLNSQEGCGTGTKAGARAAEDALLNGFTTKEDMDEADQVAINEALFELMSMEEEQKIIDSQDVSNPTEGLVWTAKDGLQAAPRSTPSSSRGTTSTTPNLVPGRRQPERDRPGRPLSRLVREADERSGKRPQSAPDNPFSRILPPPDPQPAVNPEPSPWQCLICTLVNDAEVSRCGACESTRPGGNRRPQTKTAGRSSVLQAGPENTAPLGWNCRQCHTFMESQWWTCSLCGLMKDHS